MNLAIIIIGSIVYFSSCIYLAKINIQLRRKIRGKIPLEYLMWFVFIIIYIPYSFYFPAWLTEYFPIWQRTQNTTMIMLFIGMVVSVYCLFKAGRINET
jgi:hypothetical protein